VCRLVVLDRNTLRYQSRRADNQGLRARMREIAETKRRYGCPRIYVRLRREGWRVNHKKVERLYREEGLSLRRRSRKKTTSVPRVALPMPTRPGLWYAMDFVHDRLSNGRRFKCLTMTDPYSKEVPRDRDRWLDWRGAGLPNSRSSLCQTVHAGGFDAGQWNGVRRERLGHVGRSA
jgi:putative transposase